MPSSRTLSTPGLDELVREQVLNIFGKDDADQSPVPLQESELKTKALLRRQRGWPRHFEPAEAILRISKNLPNGPDRVRCYSDRAWRWSIWQRLIGAFMRIENAHLRRKIVMLVQEIAGDDGN